MHYSGKALGKISEEFVEVALCGDRLRHLQQSLIPLREGLTGRFGIRVHKSGTVWRISQSRLKRGRGATPTAEVQSAPVHKKRTGKFGRVH
jgi:hypothetical protein